jgi:hypothetical protein
MHNYLKAIQTHKRPRTTLAKHRIRSKVSLMPAYAELD